MKKSEKILIITCSGWLPRMFCCIWPKVGRVQWCHAVNNLIISINLLISRHQSSSYLSLWKQHRWLMVPNVTLCQQLCYCFFSCLLVFLLPVRHIWPPQKYGHVFPILRNKFKAVWTNQDSNFALVFSSANNSNWKVKRLIQKCSKQTGKGSGCIRSKWGCRHV